jgi:hypothetical protein
VSKKFAVLSIVVLLLASCSSTKFAYQNAGTGVLWWVDDYISMTDDQEDQLKKDLRELLDWHCAEELPRYSLWLTEVQQDVRSSRLQHYRIAYHQERLAAFVPPLLDRVKPAIVHLLSSLSNKQVRELADNIAKRQQELEDEFLADDPESTLEGRTARTKKRIKRWLGSLNDPQHRIVEEWSANRGRQTEIWLESRRSWQQQLLRALEQRKEEGFAREIDYLIDHYDELRGPEYQQMVVESQMTMTGMLTALFQEADQRQLDFLLGKAAGLRDDFTDLACIQDGDAP